MIRRLVAAAARALVALAAVPAAASAADGVRPEVGMEDERLLLAGGPRAVEAVAEWRTLGVEVVRIHARWNVAAPGKDSRSMPAGFDAADQRDPGYDWTELDRAIGILRAAEMRVALTVTGPGPLWTSRVPRLRNPRWRPDPEAFGRFAQAVATRYRDAVDRYLIWNEPNQGGWLAPQSECSRRRCTAIAPHLYRDLVASGGSGIRRADPGAEVVFGELAPIGSRRAGPRLPMRPLPFLRTMACVDGAYRRISRGACARFAPVRAEAFGYHPHPVERAPDERNPNPGEAQLGDLGRLFGVLDRLTRAQRFVSPGGALPVHLTEFGYQTSPPDHLVGVSLAQQARWIQHAGYLAWRNGRVQSLMHYQWDDEPVYFRGYGRRSYAGWQSGLRLTTGVPKPALRAFPNPFVVDVLPGGRGRLWGQLRPGAAHQVALLRRTRGSTEWTVLRTLQTDAAGVFADTQPLSAGASYAFTTVERTADPAIGTRPLSGVVTVASASKRRVLAADAPR